jgi:alanine-glyoxylate transaminase/serine-glyoxylate transaminase/serine-pyruvate transaminase
MKNDLTLTQGRAYLAIPGPSVIPDAVLRAMHRASPNIYEGEIVEITASIVDDLRRVARTRHHAAIYICNGHGAWEAALANTAAEGDHLLVLATGRFGHGWAEMATDLGLQAEVLDFGRSGTIDLERVAEVLRADGAHRYKAVLATHVDTSSSVRNDIAALRRTMDAAGHPALLMVDCIASLACDRFEMDDWGVDVMVAASQKGIMVPAGLGFVFFNDRAAEARRALPRVSRYWDWAPRVAPEDFYQYFAGTAPTHHIYGLRAALDMIHEEGMSHVWDRHERLAQAVWAACEVWGSDGALRMNIADPALRSHAVTSLRLDNPDGTALRRWVETRLGLTLGIGLGMGDAGGRTSDAHFRLGHMGHVNGHMILGLLGGIDAGLKALGLAHGQGALEAAAGVVAGH